MSKLFNILDLLIVSAGMTVCVKVGLTSFGVTAPFFGCAIFGVILGPIVYYLREIHDKLKK